MMLPAEFLCVHLDSYEAPHENDERKVTLRVSSTDQYSTLLVIFLRTRATSKSCYATRKEIGGVINIYIYNVDVVHRFYVDIDNNTQRVVSSE